MDFRLEILCFKNFESPVHWIVVESKISLIFIFLFVCLFSIFFFETGLCHIDQASLGLMVIFLPQSLKDWEYRYASLQPAQLTDPWSNLLLDNWFVSSVINKSKFLIQTKLILGREDIAGEKAQRAKCLPAMQGWGHEFNPQDPPT